MQEALNFISLDPLRMITQTCNLIILFLLLKKFLFKPVQDIMAKRENEIADMYNNAETSQKEADDMREEYTERLANAKEEASDIIKTATTKAQTRSEELVQEAQQNVQAIKQKAEQDIEREKKKAINEIKDEISVMAVDIAEKIVEREVKQDDHEDMINKFIDNVGDAI